MNKNRKNGPKTKGHYVLHLPPGRRSITAARPEFWMGFILGRGSPLALSETLPPLLSRAKVELTGSIRFDLDR